jgi:hypothetical protein
MITCAINNIEIVKALYSDINGALIAAEKSKSEFDHVSYMKDLFKDLSKQGTPESAAKYLQSVPRLIIDAKNLYFENVKADLNNLQELNIRYKSDKGIQEVINDLSDKSNIGDKKANIDNVKNESINLNQDPEVIVPAVRLPERFKTLSPFGGSFQAYIKLNPNNRSKDPMIDIESINPELLYMIKTFDRIKNIQNNTDITNGILYDGVKLYFKGMLLTNYATPENLKFLDSDTQAQIAKSLRILKGKNAPKDVIQVNEIPILLLSDKDGVVIYFDENGNITTSDKGKPVYQFMRIVRKNNNVLSVKNIYNNEDALISPEDFAKDTYDPNIDGTEEEYLASVKKMMDKEMSDLFSLQNEIINWGATLTLPITGISNGIPSNLSSTKIYLNDLLKLPNIPSDIVKTIKTLPIDQGGYIAGTAQIEINGNKFVIERPLITEDLANEIATVLTNPKIPFEQKKKYTDQFLENLDFKRKTKKYNLFYDKKSGAIYFNIFENFESPKQTNDNIKLDSGALGKVSPETRDSYKDKIIQYLTKEGLPKYGNRTFITFNNPNLDSGTYMRLNADGNSFNNNADYYDFLSKTNSEINLKNADPGFYNYVLNFTSTTTELGKIINDDEVTSNSETERIISSALSDQYKSTVNQANPFDNYLITKYLSDEIKNNYYVDKSRDFLQSIFDNLISRNNNQYNISEKQKEFIQDLINKSKFLVKEVNENAKPPVEQDIIETVTVPGAESPEDNTIVNKIFDDENTDEDYSRYFDRANIKKEFISPIKIVEAKLWWNSKKMEPMRKLIDFGRMANIVNSDSYARFIVSGATLADTGTMGTILVNKQMGSVFQNLTIYHEAWHVFSQLFLTKKQKLDLYNELKNYTDKTGNKPYAKMSLINLEEMLAEDFRNYVKTGKAKTASPKRNTLFRQMVNFLKQLFGKILSKFKKQDIEINSLNSPMAKRLFNELYLGQFNNYTATTDNKLFYQLDRGPRQLEYPSQDALSPTDGLLVSKSIDGFFAEQLNNIYKKTGKTEIAISGITNPKARAELYKDALESFNQKLKLEKAKLKDSETDQIDFNSLDTLELIEANAVAIMEEKTGKNKYFFLTSQVSDFKNLAAATKKGERVRGEDYKETIRIVGDFYKHKTITKNGKLIDIVIISRPQDAKTQYANYKKAGADIFTNLIETPKVEKVYIEQDQEIVRDTVRILQTTIDNWGDEKSGIVKYHIENTDFEIAKKQYDIDEEEVAEDRPNELDAKTGTESLQQTLSKETIFVLKTLFKVNSDGTVPLNRLGFSELAEYGKTFAIVAKTIGGIRDRYEAYDKLKAESAKFPELKQLVETKIPNPRISGAETNTIAFNLSRQFFQDFGKPQIDYMQLYAFFETNDEGKESILNFQVKESDLAIDNVLGKWVTNFKSLRKNDFINVSPDNIRTLNLSKIVKEFKDSKSTKTSLDINKQIQFAKVLGIELQQNSNIEKELKEKPELYGLIYMFNYLDKINNLEILSTSEKLEKGQKLLLNKFKENPVETFRQGFSGKILGETGVIKELTQLKRLAELQTKYGYDASSTAVIRSNQTVGYKEVNWSSGHAKAYALNQVTEMQQLWNDPRYNYMSYLDPKLNTYTKHLKIISSLFNENGKKKANKSIKYFAQDGFSMTDLQGDSSGNITTELDPISKFIFEQHTMLLSGTAELPRTSDKKFSFGIKIEGGIDSNDINFDLTKGEDKNLYVDSKLFATNKGETYARLAYLYGYMQGEFDRIKLFRGENKDEYLNITGYNNEVNDVGEKLYSGQTFSAFKDILSEDTKKRLYALADQQLNVDLLTYVQTTDTKLGTDIKNDIQSYFNEKISDVKELYYDKLPYISRSLLEKIGIRKEDIDTNEKHKAVYTNNAIINTIIKSYVYNDWIHKFETSILLFGDYAQWDHGKEAWSKRIPGLTSDGIGFLYDANTVAFINNVFNKETYASLLEKKEGQEYNNYHFSEKINSGVIEDPIRKSIYVDEYEQMWRKDYEKTFSKEVAKEKAAKDAGVYDGITESDGIALVTLDAYRDLKKVGRGWGLAEEDLYKKIINGESVSDVSKVFSVYKLQYYGAIENNLLPVTGMYKFSVLPIIPGVNAIEGNELDKLHKKMLRQNVQLVTFSSGSKGAHLTSNGKTDNVFIDKESKYVNTEIITEGENQGEDVFKFTKNPIYLANLKEVTVMNDSFKGNLSIATQTRAIIIDNLFENGKLKNLNNFQTVQNYIESIKNYSEILKEDLLNGLGIELIDGRVIGDFTKFVEIIRNELTQRDIPAHLVFSPDTGSIITIQEAIIREKDYNRFMNSSEIDKEFIDNLKNNSVLSSLMFDELTVDILTPLFKTKLNPTIVSYISDTMSDTDAKADIIRKFGKGPDGRAKFIKAFGNNLITAIFQTYVSNFSNAKGTLVNIPESYETLPIEINDTINTDVIIENDKIIINSRAIEFDFANKLFMSNNNTEDSYKNRGKDTFPTGKNPFNNLRSFYRYSIAKAYLESNNTIDSLSNDSYFLSLIAKNNNNVDTAYTEYISERALLNSFNPQYIMGTTKYSYTDNMMQLLQSLEDNTSLKDKFSILGQLSPQPNKNGFKIVRLNNRRDMQGLTAQDYYTQIRQLGDASIQKLDNPNNSPTIESKDKRISDLFSVFSLMMFYQHGIGRTSTGFNSALDSSQYKPIIIGSSPAFISNYVEVPNSTILDVISEKTFDPIKFKLFAGNRNEYLHKDIAALEKDEVVEVTEEFDLNEGSVIPITFTAGEKIIANTDIEVYKKYINKSNGVKPYKFFTPNTNFSKFYNGKQQTMPQTAIWLLTEDTGLYDMIDQSEDSGEVYYENVDLETGIQMLREGEGTTQPGVSQTNKPKGEEVKEGIYLNQGALTKEEQLELFNYLKPYLEEQANKSLKATQGSKMIGLGLRWDYTSNNPGKTAINIPDPIKRNPKYGYYNQSINGQALGQITQRFRELMEKATGVDMTNYDGAIINLYDNDSFISSHNDVDESRSAIKYPVIGINLGGKGNFSIERLGPENAMLDLQAGSGYIFGVDGINREVWHRTFPTSQDSFLPELTTKIDGKTYPAGSYRVTITMRRVMPLAQSMPQAPSIVSDITTSTAAPITITNNPAEYTNHSGGAYGGDTFWDIIGREFGVTKHMHYKDAGNANLSQKLRNAGVTATVLTKEQMDKARTEVERLLGENYPDTLQGNLQVRNYYQVANADAVFAVAEIAPTTSPKVFGGTNTAVQLAIKMNKPVYVFDLDTNKWYTQDLDFLANGYDSTKHNFDYNGWKEINTPALTKNFAGVGSRDIESYNVQKDGKWVPRTQYKGKEVEEAAKQAIRDVYANTFKSTQPSTSVVERTDKIVLRSELKANPTTLYLFGDNDIRKGLGGQAKEMRGESNAIGVSTKKLPARGEEAYKSDTELEKNKEIITNDINKAIAEWNTGKYNKLIIPQMGVGLAELPTRAPETYKFLQQELKRLEDQVTKPSTGVERNIKVDQYNIKIQPDGTMFYENGNEVTDETIQNKANIRKELQDGVLRTSDFNNSIYFVLSNNKILGSGKTNLGKESVQNASIKEQILAKAILYKKSCSS